MNTALASTLDLSRLYWANDRRQVQLVLFHAFALPAIVLYLGSRIAPNDPDERAVWLAGSITIALGMTLVTLIGFTVMQDRILGRLALVRTAPVPPIAYYLVHQVIAVGFGVALTGAALALAWSVGLAPHGSGGAPGALLVASLAASAMGGLGAAIGMQARSHASGSVQLTVAGWGLCFLSPVLWDASVLPDLVRPVTALSPFTHTAAAMRSAFGSGEVGAGPLVGLALLSLLFHGFAYRSLRRSW